MKRAVRTATHGDVRRFWMIPLLALLVLLTACGANDPSEDTFTDDPGRSGTTSETPAGEESAAASLELSGEDHGGSFDVAAGGHVTVTLETNPSTGYLWEMELDDPEASLLEQAAEPAFTSAAPAVVGAEGFITFKLRAVDRGEMLLRFVHLPPGGTEPEDEFEIDLTVR